MGDAPYVLPELDGQRTAHHADAEIAALAERRHGVVARRQLTALACPSMPSTTACDVAAWCRSTAASMPSATLAAILDERRLARAAERAESLRIASPTSLQDLLERHPRRPGAPKIRTLLDAGASSPPPPAATSSAASRRQLDDAGDLAAELRTLLAA
jgi:hypothetical protein